MIKTMDIKVNKAIMPFMRAIFPRYFLKIRLSRDTSLTKRVESPKSAITANIMVKARAKDNIPNPETPRYLAA
jgi:hypothetical protein